MPLETAQHIHGLDKTWPLHNDPHSQGDDHLRLIKSVLLEDLGSLQGPLTLTADEINGLVQKVADALPLAGGLMSGDIRMSSGSGVTFTLSDATNDFAKIRSELDKIIIEVLDPADGTTVLKTVTIGPGGIETDTPDGTNPKELATVDYVDQRVGIMHLRDEKAAGVHGGTFTQGSWIQRDITKQVSNSISGATFTSNTFSLPAGTYIIDATVPGRNVDKHKAKLVNITDVNDSIIGTTEDSGTSSWASTQSHIYGVLTLSDTKQFKIEHRCSVTNDGDGFGLACGFGVVEVYTEIMITRIG